MKARCRDVWARLCAVVVNDRSRGNMCKLKYGRIHLKNRKELFTVRLSECCHRLPGEAVGSPFLAIFTSCVGVVLRHLL